MYWAILTKAISEQLVGAILVNLNNFRTSDNINKNPCFSNNNISAVGFNKKTGAVVQGKVRYTLKSTFVKFHILVWSRDFYNLNEIKIETK